MTALDQRDGRAAAHAGDHGRPGALAARSVVTLASALFALIIALVLLAAPRIAYACKVGAVVSRPLETGLAALALVLALAASGAALAGPLSRSAIVKPRPFALLTAIWCAALLGCQAAIARACWFEGGWDVGLVARLYPQPASSFLEYLAHYPNNLFLYDLFRGLEALARAVGIAEPYLLYIAGSCLSATAAIGLAAVAAHRSAGEAGAVAGILVLAAGSALIGVSPWILVPYSDTYAMPYPAAMLAAYACLRRPWPRWGAVGALAVIGMAVKPTAVFMAAALVAAHAIHRAGRPRGDRRALLKGAGRIAAAIGLGALMGGAVVRGVEATGPRLDPAQAVPASHFFAMGANPDTLGYFSAADERLTLSIEPSRRSAAMAGVWIERLREMGPEGTAKLAVKKLMTVFADGTLAWDQEGGFFYRLHGADPGLMAFYGIGDPAPPARAFRFAAQVLWLALLAGTACLAPCSRRRDVSAVEVASALAVLALTAFLLLSECRARYLILYAPVLACLGARGLIALGLGIGRRATDLRGRG